MPNVPSKCSERFTDPCSTETDGCCAIVPCTLCLRWEVYGEADKGGSATFSNGTWTGSVFGVPFLAYWERVYGVCEFVVIFNDEEIFREQCYGDATCKDPKGQKDVTINYVDGTIHWEKYEPKQLSLITTDDGCRANFCGTCNCTSKTLCAKVKRPYGGQVGRDELDDTDPLNCSGPHWKGDVLLDVADTVEIDVRLLRDAYTGECIIGGTADEEVLEWTVVADCSAIDARWELEDGTLIFLHSKTCHCDTNHGLCCHPRCFPLQISLDLPLREILGNCANPLPVELMIDVFSTPTTGADDGCIEGTGTLTFRTPITGGTDTWTGYVFGTCTRGIETIPWKLYIIVGCVNQQFSVIAQPVSTACFFFARSNEHIFNDS